MNRVRESSMMWKWGLATAMLSGGLLLSAAQRVEARQGPSTLNYDCILATNRVCYLTYYPSCHLQPDGVDCFNCPDIFLAVAKCTPRPDYTCTLSDEEPFNCGPKLWGVCVDGECYGSVEGEEFCTLTQCVAYPT